MKRHTQTTGIRNWYGDDIIELQSEPMKALDHFFTGFGNYIISGCEITGKEGNYNISPGIVSLSGTEAGGGTAARVARFDGASGVDLPCYMVMETEAVYGPYDDGQTKETAYIYRAVLKSSVSEGQPSIEIAAEGVKRFADMLVSQNSNAVAGYDYIVSSNESLLALSGNTQAQNVLIKNGVWESSQGIKIMPNVLKITGEAGAKLYFPLDAPGSSTVCLEADRDTSTMIENVEVVVNPRAILQSVTGFSGFSGCTDCRFTYERPVEQSYSIKVEGFLSCRNLRRCHVVMDDAGLIDSPSGFLNTYSFVECEQVNNCVSEFFSGQSNYASLHEAFRRCRNISTCQAILSEGAEFDSATLFDDCENISNCYCEGKSGQTFIGMLNCRNINNCEVEFECNYAWGATGFEKCKNLSVCRANLWGPWGNCTHYVECFNVLLCVSAGKYSQGFAESSNVFYCMAHSSDGGERFPGSSCAYPGAFYAPCENNLEGGFNQSKLV